MGGWLRPCFVALGLLFASLAQGGEAMRFVHAPPEVSGDQRATYFWELLEAALDVPRDGRPEVSGRRSDELLLPA